MAIDDLNIYTRLCEILNIYIWGGISIWGERERENCCGLCERGEKRGVVVTNNAISYMDNRDRCSQELNSNVGKTLFQEPLIHKGFIRFVNRNANFII